MLLHFCGTTFVETAAFVEGGARDDGCVAQWPGTLQGLYWTKPAQKRHNQLDEVSFLFRISLIRAKNQLVKNGTANFGGNIPTEISGPPPEVIPKIPVGGNRRGPFHLNSDRHFRNLWHIGVRAPSDLGGR